MPFQRPTIRLDYRNPQDERPKPSFLRVLTGSVCLGLSILLLALGILNIVWFASAVIERATDNQQARDPDPSTMLMAAFCSAAAVVAFRAAHRMFTQPVLSMHRHFTPDHSLCPMQHFATKNKKMMQATPHHASIPPETHDAQ